MEERPPTPDTADMSEDRHPADTEKSLRIEVPLPQHQQASVLGTLLGWFQGPCPCHVPVPVSWGGWAPVRKASRVCLHSDPPRGAFRQPLMAES